MCVSTYIYIYIYRERERDRERERERERERDRERGEDTRKECERAKRAAGFTQTAAYTRFTLVMLVVT